jgi:hypothetical protein
MPVAIDSKKLGRIIWVAESVEAARDLYREGIRDPIFYHHEIALLGEACDQALHHITQFKDVFPGSIVTATGPATAAAIITPLPPPPSRPRKKFAKGNRNQDN